MSELTMEFARRDDCLDRMVPSDLRVLIGERDALAADNKRLREALEQAKEWLEGWASAEPYLSVINAALAGSKEGDA